jgi:hypothetical protein
VQGADSDSDCLFSWSGELLSRNFYWLLAKPDVPDFAKTEWYYTPLTEYADFLALQDLPKATVNASMTVSDAYQEAAAHVTIENTGSGLAFLVRLRLLKGKDGLPSSSTTTTSPCSQARSAKSQSMSVRVTWAQPNRSSPSTASTSPPCSSPILASRTSA